MGRIEVSPTDLSVNVKNDKGGSSIKWNKSSLFNKWWWESWTATCKKKKKKLNHQLTPYTKINSRWIKDLNISHDTIEVLEENTGRKISDIPCSNIFTNMSPGARDIKERINKLDFIKLQSFCMAKENISKKKRNQPHGKTYLHLIPRTRVWSSKYIKNSQDSIPGRQTHN